MDQFDEVTRDGDTDPTAHFPTDDSGAINTTVQLCMRGTFAARSCS
jgi:hypothetical protein